MMKRALRFLAFGMAVAAAIALFGCDLFTKHTDVGEITWDQTAEPWRGFTGDTYSVSLPPGGSEWEIWGTTIYTDDSSIGTAAVHMGLITFLGGGDVTIKILAGQSSYTSSSQNGVTSGSYGSWDASFEFVTD
jgi:hypothetical protein